MRIHFQEHPWDLYGCLLYTCCVTLFLLLLGVGSPIATLLILAVPGYVLVAVLFPGGHAEGRTGIDWVERVALSFGLSVVIAPLLGFLLDFTPLGIRFVPMVVANAGIVFGLGAAALLRRMRLRPEHRLSLSLDLSLPVRNGQGVVDRGLALALAACVIVAAGAILYAVVEARPAETFTEFSLLGPGGTAAGYPAHVNVSQPENVSITIVNHEGATVTYLLRVDLVGVDIVYNATSGSNETVQVNRTPMTAFEVTLRDGANWTQIYSFSIRYPGVWMVQFLLFANGDLANVYRELHLYVQVA